MDLTRTDRLWPADALVFQTNALNLAHGACGTALFLHRACGALPPTVLSWLCAQRIETRSYPPGLYCGIAGVGWTFVELGMVERGLEVLQLVPKSPLAFATSDIFSGVSGWGLAALALYLRTGEEWCLDLACRAGDYLVSSGKQAIEGTFWSPTDGEAIPVGFALGGSGTALFLLYLWRVTSRQMYLRVAREALAFEVAHATRRGDALLWGSTASDTGHRPYWLRGGAGVAAALIRAAHLLNDERYFDLAGKAAKPCMSFFSAAPHLFEGLASMGESLLDMFLFTGEPIYLEKAREKGRQVLLYAIERPEGIAFPGRYLMKISHDFGMGGAGIGLFLQRLVEPGPRILHDIFDEAGMLLGNPEPNRKD